MQWKGDYGKLRTSIGFSSSDLLTFLHTSCIPGSSSFTLCYDRSSSLKIIFPRVKFMCIKIHSWLLATWIEWMRAGEKWGTGKKPLNLWMAFWIIVSKHRYRKYDVKHEANTVEVTSIFHFYDILYFIPVYIMSKCPIVCIKVMLFSYSFTSDMWILCFILCINWRELKIVEEQESFICVCRADGGEMWFWYVIVWRFPCGCSEIASNQIACFKFRKKSQVSSLT